MDVALILTHRCNLGCGYCYAGEHHKTDIDEGVLERAVELLFADNAETVQLSFFGGEPFLAFGAMERAVALAEAQAAARGRRLLLACTTNGSLLDDAHVRFVREHGMRVTVSIDGIEEAHDLNRPRAGGGGSFAQAHRGLRRLLDAGVACDAMMVITPATAEHTYLSVGFLWGEGVRTVRANVALEQTWTSEDRAELREQLVSIGWELLARRMRGEPGAFEPFEHAIRRARAATSARPSRGRPPRARVVVGTSGNLYPCSPMVGADRDGGPEARLRIGHLDDGPAAILSAVRSEGVRCEKGGGCECAAYLETGDRKTPGSMGIWYAAVCDQVGATIAEGLATHQAASADRAERRSKRRPFLAGLAAIVGAAAIATPFLVRSLSSEEPPRPCQLRQGKQLGGPIDTELPMPGEMVAPMPPPPPPPEPEYLIDGDVGAPEYGHTR